MIELLVIAGGLGLLVLAAIALFGWLWLPKLAREEVKPRVRRLVSLFLVAAIATGAAWSPFVGVQQRSTESRLLDEYCRNASEHIYRTVAADGLIVQPPTHDPGGAFHGDDERAEAWVMRPMREYRFVEFGSRAPGGKIRHYTRDSGLSQPEWADTRSARYGLTWRSLNVSYDSYSSVHGDETLIYDLDTGELLARRVLYYTRQRGRHYRDTYRVCRQIDVGVDPGSPSERSRDSYPFVSRVVRPTG
jgi:hypothetical protein